MQYSCGILLYKMVRDEPYFFLVHPGGPHNAGKHEHVWGIPKGIKDNPEEEDLTCAIREFEEEIGEPLPRDLKYMFISSEYNPRLDKEYLMFAADYAINIKEPKSNHCEFSWQGQTITIPEVDQCGWFTYDEAEYFCSKFQIRFIDKLYNILTN